MLTPESLREASDEDEPYTNPTTQVPPVVPLNAVNQQDKRVTKMLIIVSFCYVVFTLPTGIYVASYLYNNSMTSRVGIEQKDPAWQVLSAWNLLNHCLIFFQYIMSGKKFREESKTAFNAIVASFRLNLFGN